MRLKSFYGQSLNEAMRQVREALGENAIIVATRDDEFGGVRVTAAIDETETTPATVFEKASGSEAIEIVATALLRHQVSTAFAERLLAAATQSASDDPATALSAAFEAHLQFRPITNTPAEYPLVFVGPPGAGKTLCVAKLATQAALQKKPITVISTDTERAGGMEQLAAFTRLLKMDLVEIEDFQTLHEVVSMQPHDQIVVIDTPGCNPLNDKDLGKVRSLVSSAGGEAILVLPAEMDSNEAIDMAKEFSSVGATRLLSTRLDVTHRLGSFLRCAFESRLPLANASMTPKVTEAPKAISPAMLAQIILNVNNTNEAEVPEAPLKKAGSL